MPAATISSASRRAALLVSASVAAISLATPAQAQCVLEGTVETCSGDLSGGVASDAETVVVQDLTADVTSNGPPAIFLQGAVSDVTIDTGVFTVAGTSGTPAIAVIASQDVAVEFTGTVTSTGTNVAQGATSGINVVAVNNGGWDASLTSTGDITVDGNNSGTGNQLHVGLAAVSGGDDDGSVTSEGTIDVTVTGTPQTVVGIWSIGGVTSTVTSTGNVSVEAPGGLNSVGIEAFSRGMATVTSVGNIVVAPGNSGFNYGIHTVGLDNFVTSRGDITTAGAGIITNGLSISPGQFGVADYSEIDSVGNITTSNTLALGIIGLGNVVSVSHVGNITTGGEMSPGILAVRNLTISGGEPTLDTDGLIATVSGQGNIATASNNSTGILAASEGTTDVQWDGAINTNGDESEGIYAVGTETSVATDSIITTTGEESHGIYAESNGGSLDIAANVINTGGNAWGIYAEAGGPLTLSVNEITSGGGGVYAELGTGSNVLDIGDVTAALDGVTLVSFAGNTPLIANLNGDIDAGDAAFLLVGRSATGGGAAVFGTVNVADGVTISGDTGFAYFGTVNNGSPIPANLRPTYAQIVNRGTITGTGGTALALGQTTLTLNNYGTVNGNVFAGGGMVLNRGGTINGNVVLNSLQGFPISVFGYEGTSTGVTGTITGGAAIDSFGHYPLYIRRTNWHTMRMTKPLTIAQFFNLFPNDEVCLNHLFEVRFGQGYTCPSCERPSNWYRIKAERAYSCQWCGHHLHPTVGTPFAKTRTPLQSWFYAIYLFTTTRNGVAAKELQRQLGVTYKTAWLMADRIRAHMADVDGNDMIGGEGCEVEIDETLIGGTISGGGRGNYRSNKTVVLGMVERGGNIVTTVVADVKRSSLLPAIAANVRPGTLIHTDQNHAYRILPDHGFTHEKVNHANEEWVRGNTHVQTIEGFWGQLKRSINGTHIHVSGKHLWKYAKEAEFRFNRRDRQASMLPELLSTFQPLQKKAG